MREGRKKEASKVKQTTRQSNTAHPRHVQGTCISYFCNAISVGVDVVGDEDVFQIYVIIIIVIVIVVVVVLQILLNFAICYLIWKEKAKRKGNSVCLLLLRHCTCTVCTCTVHKYTCA